MKFTAYLTKHYAVTILAILLIASVVIPYPAEEVPEWKLLVIDENYLPGGGRTVVQKVDNPYFGHSAGYTASTDKNGFVTFPRRYMWAGASRRLLAVAASAMGWETLTSVSITADSPNCSGSVQWKSGTALPDKLVCP
ncbi:MAG TPA: hypothetical protein VMM38_10970 [Aridibacter sp.]|nr:hypothetical protein [Aridibacter sp.]